MMALVKDKRPIAIFWSKSSSTDHRQLYHHHHQHWILWLQISDLTWNTLLIIITVHTNHTYIADIHNLFLEDKKLLEQILDFYWYIIKRQWHLYANSIQGVPKKGTFKFLLIVPLLLPSSDFGRLQQQQKDMSRQSRENLKITFFGTPWTPVRNNSFSRMVSIISSATLFVIISLQSHFPPA